MQLNCVTYYYLCYDIDIHNVKLRVLLVACKPKCDMVELHSA